MGMTAAVHVKAAFFSMCTIMAVLMLLSTCAAAARVQPQLSMVHDDAVPASSGESRSPARKLLAMDAEDDNPEGRLGAIPDKEMSADEGLQRIEARLNRVRDRLRSKPADGWPGGQRGDPFYGQNVYHDAGFFRASYKEMEKHFRIFVYPDGDPALHLTHWGPHKDIYSLDGLFFNYLNAGDTKLVTTNPERANAFFLPMGVVSMVGYIWSPSEVSQRLELPVPHFTTRWRIRNYVHAYVEHIATSHKFWNRTRGHDHFMLSCHDWTPHIAVEGHPQLQTNSIHVVCNANASEPEWGYTAGHDVSMPEVMMKPPKKENEPWPHMVTGGAAPEDRTILAFYAGRTLGHHREFLMEHWGEGQDSDMQIFDTEAFSKVAATEDNPSLAYDHRMRHAKFCVCPAGFEVSSPRITEAITKDCVPVIISEGFELPFWEVLNWDTFSYRFREWDIPNLKNLLLAIPEKERAQKQRNLAVARRHFLANEPPQKYDLFHMVLHSLWLRRLNTTLAPNGKPFPLPRVGSGLHKDNRESAGVAR